MDEFAETTRVGNGSCPVFSRYSSLCGLAFSELDEVGLTGVVLHLVWSPLVCLQHF